MYLDAQPSVGLVITQAGVDFAMRTKISSCIQVDHSIRSKREDEQYVRLPFILKTVTVGYMK